jgi:hypothetical protein
VHSISKFHLTTPECARKGGRREWRVLRKIYP